MNYEFWKINNIIKENILGRKKNFIKGDISVGKSTVFKFIIGEKILQKKKRNTLIDELLLNIII